MTYENLGQAALDYFPCRYGTSKLLFRGPRRRLQDDYVAYLGGIETYGKFIELPYPTLIEHESGVKSVNLGCVNAGVDAYVTDKSLIDICTRAKVTVIQMVGAQNMSNRFYAVHPRRNDRFLKASTLLQTIYRDVDFTEFHFTRHMLSTLQAMSKDRFRILVDELQAAWLARMTALLGRIAAPVHLLWMSARHPGNALPESGLGSDPLFVTAGMLDRISGGAASLTVCVPEEGEAPASSTRGMFFAAREEAAARVLPGPELHDRAAAALAAVLTT